MDGGTGREVEATKANYGTLSEIDMKEPVDHILRPRLPWRTAGQSITECGYDASKVKTLTRAEFETRLKEYGKQRTYMFTCMTCIGAAQRWVTWDEDPRQAVSREIEWESRYRPEHGIQLLEELSAIAKLIERHREEFDSLLDSAKTEILVERARAEWVKRKDGTHSGPVN